MMKDQWKIWALFSSCASLAVAQPNIVFEKGPLKPLQIPPAEQSVLLGTSAHQKSSVTDLRYEPVEDGGFRIENGDQSFNRSITLGRNNVVTGDKPLFKMHTTTGSGVYPHAEDRCFPLFSRAEGASATVAPALGTLRLFGLDGLPMDRCPAVTTFRPGYTRYEVRDPNGTWDAKITMAPTLDHHGFVCRVEFDQPTQLDWTFGGLMWDAKEGGANRVDLHKNYAVLTELNLPTAEVYIGCDIRGSLQESKTKNGSEVRFQSSEKKRVYHIAATWGVTEYDQDTADKMMTRLDTLVSRAWPAVRDELKDSWFDCYIGRALEPKRKFTELLSNPAGKLSVALEYWDSRRSAFQLKTPNPYLNALVNFERAISEYHQMGPGMVLSSFKWLMYSHISVGWYGKMWAGDLEEVKNHLRFQAAMQAEDGFIRWISPSLAPYTAENNTAYWVDHVWFVYAWTGDKQFLQEMWPSIQKAVEWECANNDPDDDGLFQAKYEYWNCDSNGKGPKAATPTTTAWALHDRAARIAEILGETSAAAMYQSKADLIREKAFSELWNEEQGILGSIGAEGTWRGHPQTWEQYLGINNGFIPVDKGRRAMRWLEAHYGFEGDPGVNLLMNCDWWPIRWSVHWVPTGDTMLAALAGMKCGDADLWWPYIDTAVMSSFRSRVPGVNFSIGNKAGGGGGGIEFIDSDDPFMHAVVRGMFGVEPELQNGRLKVVPAFPSDWKSAELKTPQFHYVYRNDGKQISVQITTPQPTVKVVSRPGQHDVVETPLEAVSRVALDTPPEAPFIDRSVEPILVDENPQKPEPVLSDAERKRLQTLDLSAAYNTSLNHLIEKQRFVTDHGTPTTIKGWWHTISASMNEGPEKITAANGVDFLLKGRNESAAGHANNLIALSSWGPHYELPAAANISVGQKLEKLWLLMQNYVSPIKNYIPNGEVVLHYTSGNPEIISLVPPYNLDCYFQAFSRQGTSVDLGELHWKKGWNPLSKDYCSPQANALGIDCDSNRILEKIEVRAVVREGVIGINALTLLPAE